MPKHRPPLSMARLANSSKWIKTGAIATLTALCTSALIATPPGQRLKELAPNFGIEIGYASRDYFDVLTNTPDTVLYQQTALDEYSVMTPENEMKFSRIHNGGEFGTYDFSRADKQVDFGLDNGLKVRGHTLIWYLSNPDWIEEKVNSWTGSDEGLREEMLGVMYNHIDTVAGRYKGKIYTWDALNEIMHNFPKGDMRPDGPWFRSIGREYAELALIRTRQADPDAKLIINDYAIADINGKSTAYYNLFKDYISRGIPIDGLGIQMHIRMDDVTGELVNKLGEPIDLESFSENLQRFADLGLELYITELDIALPLPITNEARQKQEFWYDQILNRALNSPNLVSFQTWGFTQKYSWIVPGEETLPVDYGGALPFDDNYNAVPAYYAMQYRLGNGINEVAATHIIEAEDFVESGGNNVSIGGPFVFMGSDTSDEWVKFENVDLSHGFTQVSARYARPRSANARFEVRLDSPTGPKLGDINLEETAEWDVYTETTAFISPTSGVHDVYFVLIGNDYGEGNFDWFRFKEGDWNNFPENPDDSLAWNTIPATIEGSGSFMSVVDYSTGNADRDVVVSIFDSNWNWYGEAKFTRLAGRDSTQSVSLNIIGSIPPGDGFLKAEIRPKGGDWTTAIEEIYANVSISSGTSTVDAIVWSSTPSSVPTTGSFSASVDYSAGSGDRDIVIGVFDSNWNWHGEAKATRSAGSSGSVTLDIPINGTLPAGTVNLKADIRPVGQDWTTAIEEAYTSSTAVSAAPNLMTNGNFENGLNGWNGNGVWSTQNDADEGSSSAGTNNVYYTWLDQTVADSWGGSANTIQDLHGKAVTLTFSAKVNNSEGLRVGLDGLNDVIVTGPNWSTFSVNATVPSNASSLKVFAEPRGGNCFIDNVRLTVD